MVPPLQTHRTVTPRYIIGSGYHEAPGSGLSWFHEIWAANTVAYAPHAERIFIIADGGCAPARPMRAADWIFLRGNLGGSGNILGNQVPVLPYFMPGCPASWMAGLWIAYINECDYVYKEQDLLAFGDWVGEMYRQIGDGKAIFGNGHIHGITTAVFLIKHDFIPYFVTAYMLAGSEDVPQRIAEMKMRMLEQRWPEHFRRYSFGFDADRPFDPTAKVFTVQKLTTDDLRTLADHKLINIAGMPEGVPLFSNHNP